MYWTTKEMCENYKQTLRQISLTKHLRQNKWPVAADVLSLIVQSNKGRIISQIFLCKHNNLWFSWDTYSLSKATETTQMITQHRQWRCREPASIISNYNTTPAMIASRTGAMRRWSRRRKVRMHSDALKMRLSTHKQNKHFRFKYIAHKSKADHKLVQSLLHLIASTTWRIYKLEQYTDIIV